MKKIVVCLCAVILLLASCATSGTADGEAAAAEPGSFPAGSEPVKIKTMILFADGSLDEYITSEYDDSLTNLRFQNRHSASGALIETVEHSYQEGTDVLVAKTTTDADNKLKSRLRYQYNDQGKLWKEVLFNKADAEVSSTEYVYDDKGNRTKRIVSSGPSIKLAETNFTFSNSGAEEKSETLDGAGRKIASTENTFDAGGNLINQKVFNFEGKVTAVYKTEWQGKKEISNERINADGTVQLRITNEYDNSGVLLRKLYANANGDIIQIVEYKYTLKPADR